MAQTNLMKADDIATAFNTVADRQYWRASVAGTRVNPEVHFNSRSSMVRVTYRIATSDFTLTFSKTSAAFGDFLASAYRSLEQVMTSLVAAGLPFSMPVEANPTFRLEYSPVGKTTVVWLANAGDDWRAVEPLPFKVPERNNSENPLSAIDAI